MRTDTALAALPGVLYVDGPASTFAGTICPSAPADLAFHFDIDITLDLPFTVPALTTCALAQTCCCGS